MTDKYTPQTIEPKWQSRWDEEKLYQIDLDKAEKPFYNLTMFPYPSAAALHVGHVYCYGGTDAYGRFKRLQGYDVFEPMGFDAFGIHAENYALKIGEHPQQVVPRNIKHFRDEQMKKLGAMFDWSRQVDTTDPGYYKWTQWVFLQMHKAGLVERRNEAVDWCPSCKTVLANEQVIDGKCERCGTEVEQKQLEQWFFKITQYADRLLDGLDKIDWPDRTKALQRHWIGKKTGIDIRYRIEGSDDFITCFTTRPETNFGATFVVLAPEHALVDHLTTPEQRAAVDAYRESVKKKTDMERTELSKEKSGVFTGSYCLNDLNGAKMPIWIGDFVLAGFGTGAVVGVPGHDGRDFEFAQMAGLPIERVLSKDGDLSPVETVDQVFEDDGVVVNSGFLDGMKWDDAREAVMAHIEQNGWGERTVSYRLHDWLISRQRYWGPPIPMIHCDQCGWVPVPEDQLPVVLPKLDKYEPDGSGRGPLATLEDWVNTTCPQCDGPARRETDVSDTFLDSAWYELRYPSTEFDDKPFDKARTAKWLPVDMYIGGIEHATMHLLYFRFVTMVLHDLGHLDFEEPAKRLRHQGLIIKDGAKMSKSRGNVVNPDEYIAKYGADAFRTYMLFIGPYEEGGEFNDKGILGAVRYFEKVWDLLLNTAWVAGPGAKDMAKLHATIKKLGADMENFQFNTAVAALMEFGNWVKDHHAQFSADQWAQIKQLWPVLLAPFAPHLAEELWERLGYRTDRGSVHDQGWPDFDPAQLVTDTVTLVVQVNGKLRDQVEIARDATEAEAKEIALGLEKVTPWIDGKAIRRVIYVPNRLINIVV
jgi:leucyl-tRNA synthetase